MKLTKILFLIPSLMLGSVFSTAYAQSDNQSARQLVVMTSYPDEMVSRFEAAFEQAHPEYQLQVLWRSSSDAMDWIRQSGASAVDVYWTPSPRNFEQLAAEGKLQPLAASLQALPEAVGNTALRDAGHFYTATEVAGYGFVVNPEALAQAGLAVPTDWTDLTHADYRGRLSVPAPTVGFAPVMIDIVLQSYGWDLGWQVWSEIVANARLASRGASFITDEIQSGDSAVGISIDFFAAAAIAGGAPLDFVYPQKGGLNPAHIAVFADAPNPEGADAFVDFVLSVPGQTLMAHPDIRKLPVNPAAYANLSDSYHNPFEAARQGAYNYNSDLGRPRLALIAELFDQSLSKHQPRLTELWQGIQQAEASGRDMSEARRLLSAPLLTEAQAEAMGPGFSRGEAGQEIEQLRVRWQQELPARFDTVARML